jgi:hypothetical protein
MKTGKLKKFETVAAPLVVADTDEELAAFIAELVAIGEKLPSRSVSGETLADILADFKKPKTTIVETFDGKRVEVKAGVIREIISGGENVTEHNSVDAEKILDAEPTVFNSEQLRILESLKNG